MNTKLIIAILGGICVVALTVVLLNGQAHVVDKEVTEEKATADNATVEPVDKPSVEEIIDNQGAVSGPSGYDPGNPETHTATQHPYLITQGETNPRALSILEARTTKQFPERLSLYHKPKPFDLKTWKKDETAYLNVVEPGRIDQMADQSAPSIERVGSRSQRMQVCTVLPVQFKAKPNSPVSLVVTRGGIFTESKTNAVTVKSNAEGIATAHYYATRGTVHQTEIMAASPMNFGQAHVLVTVVDANRDFDQAALQARTEQQSQLNKTSSPSQTSQSAVKAK